MKPLNQPIILRAKVFLSVLAFVSVSMNIQSGFAQSKEKIHIGFIYPLSTNGTHAILDTNTLSLHALVGVSAEERGFAASGLTNVVRNNTHGY